MQPVDVTIWIPAVMRLREVHVKAKSGGYNTRLEPWLTGYEEVFMEFQPMFAAPAIPHLSAEDFLAFLHADRIAQDAAKQADVVAQRPILLGRLFQIVIRRENVAIGHGAPANHTSRRASPPSDAMRHAFGHGA